MKYKETSRGILKDGHTMFTQDIVADLNRKEYLEGEYMKLKERVTQLEDEVEGLGYEILDIQSRNN